ncbi:Alpha/Beta hydrolase protein [Cubamyces lactineus]|nr:Alpha/Beta hydrolase protein [Cubamyces lactineus]
MRYLTLPVASLALIQSVLCTEARSYPATTARDVSPQDFEPRAIVQNSTFEWGPCDPAIVSDPTLTCSFFDVPLDYHDLSAGYGRLAVAKANATGPRRGSVLVNPGGPGESGLEEISEFLDTLRALTGGEYDIVTWDPRGVGSLTIPGDIFCFDDTDEYNSFWNGTIELTGIDMTGNFTDPEEIRALLAQAPIMQAKYEELGQRCLDHPTGKYLRYVGTAATARDVVALVDALDGLGSPVNYIGFSYGTILGSWLINMFPERVGHVVLDGPLNPINLATKEVPFFWTGNQLQDADKVFDGFVTGCALSGPTGCAIASEGATPSDVNNAIQTLLQSAHDAALQNSSVPVQSGLIRAAIYSAMSWPSLWASLANTTYPELAEAVASESRVQAERLAARRTIHSRRTSEPNTTPVYGPPAIICGDGVDQRGTSMEEIFQNIIYESGHGSTMFTSVWPLPFYYCPFWPVRAVERYQGPFNRSLQNKVLILGNTFDPLTPFADAEKVTTLLKDDAVLVRQNGFGHTTIADPSDCIVKLVSAYFVNETVPEVSAGGVVCEVDATFELFQGVNTSAILSV